MTQFPVIRILFSLKYIKLATAHTLTLILDHILIQNVWTITIKLHVDHITCHNLISFNIHTQNAWTIM